jgi:hypothetical protein
MKPIMIGLVDVTSKAIVREKINAAVMALNIQVTKHLRKCWTSVPEATVFELKAAQKFDAKTNAPPGIWPVILTDKLAGGYGGFHLTNHYQPYAEVSVADDSDDWTIAASHEILEMLVDPSGHRLVPGRGITCAGRKIEDAEGESEYVFEICDPCEAKSYAYKIGDTWVSDFATPDYYACTPVPNARYSFRHNIGAPRRILPGGYITWVEPGTRRIQQIVWLNKAQDMKFVDQLGLATQVGSANLREFVDKETRKTHRIHEHCGSVRKLHRGRTDLPLGDVGIGFGDLDKDHWVTYHQDGVIERKIYEKGSDKLLSSCMETVRAHEPIFRPRDPTGKTHHKVTNKSCDPIIPFDKDLIDDESLKLSS